MFADENSEKLLLLRSRSAIDIVTCVRLLIMKMIMTTHIVLASCLVVVCVVIIRHILRLLPTTQVANLIYFLRDCWSLFCFSLCVLRFIVNKQIQVCHNIHEKKNSILITKLEHTGSKVCMNDNIVLFVTNINQIVRQSTDCLYL